MALHFSHASSLGVGLVFLQLVWMLFGNASTCITINDQQSKDFNLYRSIYQGFPLAPSLYVLVAKGFVYLLANNIYWGLVHGITLPNSTLQLVNNHFAPF